MYSMVEPITVLQLLTRNKTNQKQLTKNINGLEFLMELETYDRRH